MVIMASATTTAVTDATEVGVVIIILECGSCMVVVDGNRVGWALGFCSEGHERTYVFSTLSGSPLSIISEEK